MSDATAADPCRACRRPQSECGPLDPRRGLCIDCERAADLPADLPAVQPTVNPLALIDRAMALGMKSDELSKLFDLQERWEKNRAAEAFGLALSMFQAQVPTVFKRRTADTGTFKYKFASYDDVMREVGPILAQCGLSVTFDTEQAERFLRIKCHVRHGTHVQSTSFCVPVPDVKVNDAQKFGIALSYAKRYALCAALNVVVTDEDDDAAGLIDAITPEQRAELDKLMVRKGYAEGPICKWLAIPSLDELRMADYAKTHDFLTRKPDVKVGGK